MTIYSRLADTATRLLAGDMGGAVTLRKQTGGTYDPVTGDVTGESNSDTTTRGAYISIDERLRQEFSQVDRSDLFLVLNNSVEPDNGDKIVDGSNIYTIIEVSRRGQQPGATTPAVYIVQLRA